MTQVLSSVRKWSWQNSTSKYFIPFKSRGPPAKIANWNQFMHIIYPSLQQEARCENEITGINRKMLILIFGWSKIRNAIKILNLHIFLIKTFSYVTLNTFSKVPVQIYKSYWYIIVARGLEPRWSIYLTVNYKKKN